MRICKYYLCMGMCLCMHPFFFLFCNIYKGTKIFNCKFSLSMCWVLWHTQRWKIQCYSILLLFSSITVGDRYFTWVVNVYLCIYILTIIGRYYCISGTCTHVLSYMHSCCAVMSASVLLYYTSLCCVLQCCMFRVLHWVDRAVLWARGCAPLLGWQVSWPYSSALIISRCARATSTGEIPLRSHSLL